MEEREQRAKGVIIGIKKDPGFPRESFSIIQTLKRGGRT